MWALALLGLAGAQAADWRALNPTQQAELRSEGRVALVIGNAAYEAGPLRNPVRDAEAMAERLTSLGFETTLLVDTDRRSMIEAIRAFGEQLGAGGTGVFYFAGHGIGVEGRNYLVPIDADIGAEAHVETESVDVNRVLGRMEGAGNRLNIVILDACRNNPYERAWRSSGGGLEAMDAPAGTLIAFATGPRQVAMDGRGEHGIYTGALLGQIGRPGLDLEDTFKAVRLAVKTATEGAQVPQEYTSVTGEFYFALPTGDQAAPVTAPVVAEPAAPVVEKIGGPIERPGDDVVQFAFGLGVPVSFGFEAPAIPYVGRLGAKVQIGNLGVSIDGGEASHGVVFDEVGPNSVYGSAIVAASVFDRVYVSQRVAVSVGLLVTQPLVPRRTSSGNLDVVQLGAGAQLGVDVKLGSTSHLDAAVAFTGDTSTWFWPSIQWVSRFGGGR